MTVAVLRNVTVLASLSILLTVAPGACFAEEAAGACEGDAGAGISCSAPEIEGGGIRCA